MGGRRGPRNAVELPEGCPPPLLTAQQAAALLGVPLSWVRRQTCEGRLPKVQLGPGTVRYSVEDLMDFTRRRTVAKPEPGPKPPRKRRDQEVAA